LNSSSASGDFVVIGISSTAAIAEKEMNKTNRNNDGIRIAFTVYS
jgi:hypothetical protein